MGKIGISIDYSNICKDYNTVYLDRDNTDPATKKCMTSVLKWMQSFLNDLLAEFGYQLHNVSSESPVKVDDVAAKRFLFYSLEKEIMLQSYVIQKSLTLYDSLAAWEANSSDSIMIQNDEDGSGIALYMEKGSQEETWIRKRLEAFSLDEVAFEPIR
ncbi:MAG TPA: hypothetical protein ENK68_01070 [Epsilonproteobacteria bacterium]|nr:hypothetical protein [Campylobacterota bacterium]